MIFPPFEPRAPMSQMYPRPSGAGYTQPGMPAMAGMPEMNPWQRILMQSPYHQMPGMPDQSQQMSMPQTMLNNQTPMQPEKREFMQPLRPMGNRPLTY